MIGLVIFIIMLFMIFPTRKANFSTRFFGHRGLYEKDQSIRENSVEAFQKAINHEVGIELDVQLSKDQKVVVFHDDDLKRLFGINQLICDIDSLELSKMGIPLFQDILSLVDGRVPLIVEIKPGSQDKLLSAKVVELLQEYQGEYSIESFDPRIVYEVKKLDSSITRGQLLMPIQKYKTIQTGVLLNSLLYNFLTRPDFIAVEMDLYNKNPMVWLYSLMGGVQIVWTVHEENHLQVINHPIIYEFYDAKNRK